MEIPFTIEMFLDIFRAYNEAVWPAQLIGYGLTALALFAIGKQHRRAGQYTCFLLAFFWLWTGVIYHFIFFTRINPAAPVFAALTTLEGIILAIAAAQNRLVLSFKRSFKHIIGYLFLAYATIVYPLIGMVRGHTFPAAPIFPLTPCPMTIFTFGVFLLSVRPVRWYVWTIPLLWSLIGSVAAIKLTIIQDYGLLIAGILGTLLISKK